MESSILLVLAGFIIGTFGTLIGAGGGFILVPLLLLFYPELPPQTVTAISMAVVAVNAISGTIAYAKSGRIDYKAGILFALFTIPGSILGVYSVKYIPIKSFNLIFGILMILLSAYLFYKNSQKTNPKVLSDDNNLTHRILTDKQGVQYEYSYKQSLGIVVSILVGYLSPLLGIGGGIIHVPAMVNWLQFPVYIATATSHFILSVMATVSVVVHFLDGQYNNPEIVKMILLLCLGVVPGAQLGAYLSHKIKGKTIIKILACCLILVGIRIILKVI
ncbi:anion permease [Flavobacterium noncentrifugens]|uniref:Probable membrane transporter protein n=1 Tax=Flavobacterium noncentrifugens TaxID=1128970 RepID=A0A1G8YKB6_9FLAO|nr:sulfite exporter TauE/SafE family protein [Flavobacterium noncentrifugens]GEP51255.1 anion permease [Flavobacterium noncentrifugens]SDK03107.1 hypothetical protein SAMN04487935_2365 [Flavobacterium noncentrifugens]